MFLNKILQKKNECSEFAQGRNHYRRYWMISRIFCSHLRAPEYASLKYATLTYRLFWAESILETADSTQGGGDGGGELSPLSYLAKSRTQISIWKVTFLSSTRKTTTPGTTLACIANPTTQPLFSMS